ncbi:hypothetical protein vseg_009944 [Gypsophila vaccaria]
MEPSKIEVKIISTEIIKPTSPTPSHLRKLALSLLDQKYAALVVPVLLFYGPPQEPAQAIDIDRFKTCLSQTLTAFYPLAGRVESQGTILCNDEGVPFTEAHVNCTLENVLDSLSSYKKDLVSFYPPRAGLIEEGLQVSIQVNVFKCGGFCIGWYHTHKVTDGTSVGTFFRYWAALVAEQHAAQYLADFNSAVRVFPPVPVAVPPPQEEKPVTPELNPEKQDSEQTEEKKEEKKPSSKWSFLSQTRIGVRSFLIGNEAVEKLKAKSISHQVTNPSRFEAVAGFLWKSVMLNSTKEGRSALNVAVDLRPRVDPPLPVGAMGNLFETALVQSEKNADLHELVAQIRESISKMKDLAMEYQGEKREEAKDGHWKKFINAVIECKGKDLYVITPWCKSAGFGDVDFGFGNPRRVVPVDDVDNHNQRNMIILTEFGGSDGDGDGFEAWMFLEEACIKFMESNSEFVAFATPNF